MAEITYAHINQEGQLVILLSDDRVINVGKVIGPAGPAGAQGRPGVPGPAGEDGRTIHSFTGLPDPAVGRDGDYAIDHFNWVIYGPKSSLGWGAGQPLLAGVRNGLGGSAPGAFMAGGGVAAAGAGATPSGTSAHYIPKLQELADVIHTAQPHLGEGPIWTYAAHGEAQAKFQWGTPNAHIKTWDATRHWESGACVYHEGRLWRATQDNTNVEPVMDEGKATLYFYIKGEPTFGIVPMLCGYNAPPAGIQPVAFNFRYWYAIEYRGDNDATIWKMELRGKDPNGHIVGEWTGKPWPVLTWKNIIPPPKAPPGFVYLWIYTTPGVNHTPIIGQQTWAPLEFGSYIGAADDVSATNPHTGDILMFDATHHKWTATSLADLKAKLDAIGGAPPAPSSGAPPIPTNP